MKLPLKTSPSGADGLVIFATGSDVLLEYTVAGAESSGVYRIRFTECVAYRYAGENYMIGMKADAYDAVVDFPESEWLTSTFEGSANRQPRQWSGEKHFAVFISNFGLFEALAKAVREELPEDNEGNSTL